MKEENNTNYKYQYQDGECWLNKVDENAGSDELFERALLWNETLPPNEPVLKPDHIIAK